MLDTSLIRSSGKPNIDVAKYATSQIDLWRGNYITSLIDDTSPNIITWHNATSLISVTTHFATSPTLVIWHFSHIEMPHHHK
jgi:dTDP-4-dehydrorhamnose reductase